MASDPAFQSILFADAQAPRAEVSEAVLVDLNLDQVIATVVAGREEHDLTPLLHTPLQSVESIAYRHEVLDDLRDADLVAHLNTFAQGVAKMRTRLERAATLRYRYQQERWQLDAVQAYCGAVDELAAGLATLELTSRGLLSLRAHLADYVDGSEFRSLSADTDRVKTDLLNVRYAMTVRDNRVTVHPYQDEADYSEAVEQTFARFKERGAEDHRVTFRADPDMDHVEAGVLELVARRFPEVFSALDDYCERHADFGDPVLLTVDREIQFYLAFLEFVAPLAAAGLPFCHPQLSMQPQDLYADDAFDVALANTLGSSAGDTIVCNDWHLDGSERILVVTGPNNGGKTTFARAFGQIHYFAALGLPVPAREARLLVCDELFTHFERAEDSTTLSGKLEDELIRVHHILARATGESIVILNESFSSTTLADALFLGTEVLRRLVERDLLCVYVTFIDELSRLGETTVSMVSSVDPDNQASRTYKLERRPADGLAFATALARHYGLDYESLTERIAS